MLKLLGRRHNTGGVVSSPKKDFCLLQFKQAGLMQVNATSVIRQAKIMALLTVGVALWGTGTAPVSANPVFVGPGFYGAGYGVPAYPSYSIQGGYSTPYRSYPPSSSINNSTQQPIFTSPSAGTIQYSQPGYYYPGGYVDPYGGNGAVVNSTLINPTVVNSPIYNSTLINPTIVKTPVYPRRIYQPGISVGGTNGNFHLRVRP